VCAWCVLCIAQLAINWELQLHWPCWPCGRGALRLIAACCLLGVPCAMPMYAGYVPLSPMSHVPCPMPVMPAVSSTYPVYPETENREKTGNGGGAGYFLLRNLKRAEPVHTAHVHDVPRASCSHFALFMCFFGGWWHTDLPLASQLPAALALNAWPRWTLPPRPPPPTASTASAHRIAHCHYPPTATAGHRHWPLAATRHRAGSHRLEKGKRQRQHFWGVHRTYPGWGSGHWWFRKPGSPRGPGL
jgi:hypothetical protein